MGFDMKKTLLLFIGLLVTANLAAQDSSFVSISVGNKYVYERSYKYHGGHAGLSPGFTVEVLKDTLLGEKIFYIAKQSGLFHTSAFPFITSSEQDTSLKYLIRSDLNTFGYYNMKGDTIFVFDKNLEVAISDSLDELSAFNYNYGEDLFGVPLNEWEITTNGLFNHDLNGVNIAEKFGLRSAFNVIGGGSGGFYLIAAIVGGQVYGDSTQVSNEFENEEPVSFYLSQNYPNPFNPTTSIDVLLPYSSVVLLEVFDVTGKKVAKLFEGKKNEGAHTFIFDAINLPSGIYFYRLEVNGQVRTRKMALLK